MITTFNSNDHIRYENGVDVSGHNKGCKREIKIEQNKNYFDAFTVSVLNNDTYPPAYSMGEKRMKIVQQTNDKIEFRGFGVDSMGFSFAGYGLTLKLKNGKVEEAIAHIFDRNISISYLYDPTLDKSESSIEKLIKDGLLAVENKNSIEIFRCSKNLVDQIKNDVDLLNSYTSENKTELRKVSTILFEASRSLEKNHPEGNFDLLLMALLLNILDYNLSPGFENIVADRILLLNKQPGLFSIFIERHVIPNIGNKIIIKENSTATLSMKLFQILESQVLLTSFLKNRSSFKEMCDYYNSKINEGFFAPVNNQSDLNKAIDKLLNLIQTALIRYFKSNSSF